MEHDALRSVFGSSNVEAPPPTNIPHNEWQFHPILRNAMLNIRGDAIEWPKATFEQLAFLRQIALIDDDGVLCARLASQFNFDRFVDVNTDENGPAHPPAHVPDRQRFYTRVTENGFHVAGIFSALTIEGRRRYFQWLAGKWVEVGLNGFLSARDDLSTHFSEIDPAQLEQTQPGAMATPVMAAEEWTVETMQEQYAPVPAPTLTPPPPPPPTLEREITIGGEAFNSAVQGSIAVAIATMAHRGKLDFTGAASIDHVARVAESFDVENDGIRCCVAWLHNVLDVGDLSERDLLDAGVAPEIVEIVSLLTHSDSVEEEVWLAAIAGHPHARAVKIAAINDDSATWRLRKLDLAQRAQIEFECNRMLGQLTDLTAKHRALTLGS